MTIFGNQGEYDLAIEAYQKAISINPEAVVLHHNLGSVYRDQGKYYYKQGKYGLAVRFLQKAIDIDPKDAEAHQKLGLAYYRQDKYELAVGSPA